MAARVVLTYADLAALPEDGKRYELYEGELSITPSPRTRHQQVVGNLYLVVGPHVRERGLGEVFLSPIDVIFSNVTVLVPDLVFVDTSRLGLVTERGIEGPPTLVVEVLSPTTTARDRGVKRRLYAGYGVPHYWLADHEARVIETYRLSGEDYEEGPQLAGSTPVALPPLLDLMLDPVAVWR